jgi:hypothetical protein
MMARREVLGGTLVGALIPAGGGGQQVPERAVEEVASAVRDVRHAIEQQQDFHEIVPVRLRITDFLRSQMKFPDFLDIGTDVWYTMYDWHVRNVQPIVMNRDPQGRYTIQFMSTTLVLRPDLVPNYIGTPYDNR